LSLWAANSVSLTHTKSVTNNTKTRGVKSPKMSVAGYKIQGIETKRKDNQMLSLSYTVEKEGNLITIQDRLMLSESQINNLMDSLVSYGFNVLTMEVK